LGNIFLYLYLTALFGIIILLIMELFKMDEKIKSIIKEIIANTGISVENIVFFGSRARGDADPDSDYDIILITSKTLKNKDRLILTKAVRTALAKLLIPADVLVLSKSEVDARRSVPGSIIRNALREGISV